ncbi:class I SAM-dependent methyltransferase [Mucilaginibacter dorajii]|uniref:Class I SAM-dependent methyltransferase n=1 Tax=Mucilaginibacter dorajii TaxID=692994 RepID=A0ABP7PHI2_9SPHI|nr:class I SAM-dependent methyltransferase [Mucilaginibacter dorajii]MCS3735490.1 trans-aconitate methyltransferase [Mucilaginibacter dorajii]
MSTEDKAAIFDYHRSMISFHGNTGPAALGWRDRESQLIRFKVLAGIADLDKCSILDAGCGHADFLGFLLPKYPDLVYTGVEQIPELLNEAERRYGNRPDTTLMPGDFTDTPLSLADYVFASGSLNYYQTDPDFIYRAIKILYNCSKKGLAFNLLHTIIPNGLLAAYEPGKILDFCKTLSDRCILTDNYSEEDFTIFMYK